jgi:5-methylcytosine-specific restriction protein B
MAKFVRMDRVSSAIKALADWRSRAKSQQAMHLWPLLSLVRGKVTKTKTHRFTEADEFAFWNAFFRLPGDVRPDRDPVSNDFTQGYYIDPLVLSLKPSDYPHRSPWTIRARTFLASWRAVESDESHENWKLSPNFAEIVVNKVLTRGDETHRVPIVDLAVWLFRDRQFPDRATSKNLETTFRTEFPFDDSDYNRIFEYAEEEAGGIFVVPKPSDEELTEAIKSVMLAEDATTPDPPPLHPADVESQVDDDDEIYLQVKSLLEFGTSGIIFRGCPGTSKTWYAKQIAYRLVDEPSHIYQCQFHPSYGYEDFVEGYKPDEDAKSGFSVTDKIFLDACRVAEGVTGNVVFIIDEINRGDPARVFGELLTYIEHEYRGDKFRKAYTGEEASVPKNLIVFGTMNQYDRSITQLDLALSRRFASIDLKPSSERVEEFLQKDGGFSQAQIDRVVKWFDALQNLVPNGIGHTYFTKVKQPHQLRLVWQYWMLPYCEMVLELEKAKLTDVKNSFEGMMRGVMGQGDS